MRLLLFLAFEQDCFGSDMIGELDDSEKIVAIVGKLAHALAGFCVIVAYAQLEDKEIFEMGGGIMGEAAIGVALYGDVHRQG